MYLKNNIQFRIISSLSKSYFLQTQHYYLKLMLDDIESFDIYSREIILLNFEMWFRFITKIEKFLIFSAEPVNIEHILYEFKHTDMEIQDIIRSNPKSFDNQDKKLNIFNGITKIFYTFLELSLVKYKNQSDLFSFISKMLALYIQNKIHITADLHNHSISATDFCLELQTYKIPLLYELAKLYNVYDSRQIFKIKNYLLTDIPLDCLKPFKDSDLIIDSII